MAGEANEAGIIAQQRRRSAVEDCNRDGGAGGRGDKVQCERSGLIERQRGRGACAEKEEKEEAAGLMARGTGSGRWNRQRTGMFNTLLRCNLPPETQKVVVFIIMMLLIVINVVLMFLLAFQ